MVSEESSNNNKDVESTAARLTSHEKASAASTPSRENASASTTTTTTTTTTAAQEERLHKMSGVMGVYAAVILGSLFFIYSMKDVLGYTTQDYTSGFANYVTSPYQYNTAIETVTSPAATTAATINKEEEEEIHHSAAMCVIQKSTLKYFEEWILYHHALGFEKIYLYDNSDDFEVQDWIGKQSQFIQDIVNVTHWPGVKQQVKAYLNCWGRIRDAKSHAWISFFDVDEFVVIKDVKKYPKIMDLLDSLPDHQYGLAINWINFGYNGHLKYEDKPVTLRFQNRAVNETSFVVKSMVRSQVSPKMKNPHWIKYKLTKTKSVYMSRDSRGNVVQGPSNEKQEVRDIALYHYISKSLEEYKDRCNRGDVLRGQADWATMPWCESDEKVLGMLKVREEPVFDDRPWKLLQERVPEYTKRYT